MTYELRLSTGGVAQWDGADAIDAARRYVQSHPDARVVAWRDPLRTDAIGGYSHHTLIDSGLGGLQ